MASSHPPNTADGSFPPESTSAGPRGAGYSILAFITLLVVGIGFLGLQTGPDGPIPEASLVFQIAGSALVAGCWLVSALAIGAFCVRRIPILSDSLGTRWSLGIALLLWLDLGLGSFGWLGRDHRWLGIACLTIPAAIWVVGRCRRLRSTPLEPNPPWLLVPTALPIGVLLVAAASVPGWLWATEFGGFDALSYHLQVPREWWFANGIVELPHNAYAYLPGGVSAAFLHLMTVTAGPADAAIACQLLVAGTTLIAMLTTAELVVDLGGTNRDGTRVPRSAPLFGSLLLIATPWIVVAGSLAYDEAFVIVLASAALSIVLRAAADGNTGSDRRSPSPFGTGLVLGVLLGATVLAKASSVVLVVVPIALAAAVAIPSRRWPVIVAATALGGVVVCLPWLVRNAVWTGNPVFPFATGLFGMHDWSSSQVARFATAHASRGPIEGLHAILGEFLLDDVAFDLPPGEPIRPQWWWLPGGGLLATIALVVRARASAPALRRALAMLVVLLTTIAMWSLFTHAKARFLLPVAPVLAAAIAVVAAPLFRGSRSAWIPLIVGWLVALVPVRHYLTERDGAPAWGIVAREAFDGRLEAKLSIDADPRTRAALRANASPAFILRSLPDDSRTLLVGIATPFHLPMESGAGTPDRIVYSTVWTRGPLERALVEVATEAATTDETGRVIARLRDRGFTHLLFSPTMLEVWTRSGWLDPALTPERLNALLAHPDVAVEHTFADDGVLLNLEPAR